MRNWAIGIAIAALAISGTADAQSNNSTGQQILRGVLDSLLGPNQQQPQQPQQQVQQPQTKAQRMAQVLADPRRADDTARDRYRHPAETLDFFRVEPGMVVADYMPAGGWYSRVLIPYLGSDGTYIGVDPYIDSRMTGYWDTYRNTPTRLPREARQWVGLSGARVIGVTTDDVPNDLQGTVDRFLIFREVHNMRRYGWLHESLMTARKLLKPDGLLGVVQHRARDGAPQDEVMGDKGYQREEDVIDLFRLHGFDLVARSPVNDNPADPSDFAIGVWALPPGYAGTPESDSAERARLDAIGESDRMTLLFRKRV